MFGDGGGLVEDPACDYCCLVAREEEWLFLENIEYLWFDECLWTWLVDVLGKLLEAVALCLQSVTK